MPGYMPVIQIINQLLDNPLYVASISIQKLLVAIAVCEAHFNQLIHRSDGLHRNEVAVGDGR